VKCNRLAAAQGNPAAQVNLRVSLHEWEGCLSELRGVYSLVSSGGRTGVSKSAGNVGLGLRSRQRCSFRTTMQQQTGVLKQRNREMMQGRDVWAYCTGTVMECHKTMCSAHVAELS